MKEVTSWCIQEVPTCYHFLQSMDDRFAIDNWCCAERPVWIIDFVPKIKELEHSYWKKVV